MSHPKTDFCDPKNCNDLDDFEENVFGMLQAVYKGGSMEDARATIVGYLASDAFPRDGSMSSTYDKYFDVLPQEVYARLAGRRTLSGETANRHIGAKHAPHVLAGMTIILHCLKVVEAAERKQNGELRQRIAVLEGKLDTYANPKKFIIPQDKLSSGDDEPCVGGWHTFIPPENGYVLTYCPLKVVPGKTLCAHCAEKEVAEQFEKRQSELKQQKEELKKKLAELEEEEKKIATTKKSAFAGEWRSKKLTQGKN